MKEVMPTEEELRALAEEGSLPVTVATPKSFNPKVVADADVPPILAEAGDAPNVATSVEEQTGTYAPRASSRRDIDAARGTLKDGDDDFKWSRQTWGRKLHELADDETPTAANPTGKSLHDTTPAWYRQYIAKLQTGGGPPNKNQFAADIVSTLGEAAAAGANANKDNKLRSVTNKARDASRAALFSGGAQALSGLLRKSDTEYDRNLSAAGKQAALQKLAGGGKDGTGGLSTINALRDYHNALGQDQTRTRLGEGAAAKAEDAQAKDTVGTPEAIGYAQAVAKANNLDPKELVGKTWNEIDKVKTALADRAKENARVDIFDYQQRAGEGKDIDKENRGATRHAADEQLKVDKAFEEAHVPGIVWLSGHPPSAGDVTKVKEYKAGADLYTNSVQTMLDAQKELEHQLGAWSIAGKPLQMFWKDSEAQKIMDKAQTARGSAITSLGALSTLGTLQASDIKRLESMLPDVGNPQAFFNGAPMLQAALDEMPVRSRNWLKGHTAGIEGTDVAPPRMTVKPVEYDRGEAPTFRGRKSTQPATPTVPKGAPATPAPESGTRSFSLSKDGVTWSAPRPLTLEQVKQARDSGLKYKLAE